MRHSLTFGRFLLVDCERCWLKSDYRRFAAAACLFTAYFCTFFLRISFHVLGNLHRVGSGDDSKGRIYIYYTSFRSRDPEKNVSHLKSHFRSVSLADCALKERYIVTAASDIYFCKHRGCFVRRDLLLSTSSCAPREVTTTRNRLFY